MVWQCDPDVIFLSRWHISVLLDKTKKYAFGGMSHVKYLVPKTVFFLVNYLRDHYAVLFYTLLCKLILLFLRFEFAQESKNFPGNGHRWCPKTRSTKPFWENPRVARCFAELFQNINWETIYAVVKMMRGVFKNSSSCAKYAIHNTGSWTSHEHIFI